MKTLIDDANVGCVMVAWREWLRSDEGRQCASSEGLTSEEYLRNRLQRAFLAGVQWSRTTQPPQPEDSE